ncbi:MAG: putative DNA modification/repair radical SAM protein [Dehalococcoidales bacterium]|nr:putative DNA modification/repair radical SAM protein [Dehalococcoidales bacterium]
MPCDKLDILAAAAKFDVCGYTGMGRTTDTPLRFIHKAVMPNGRAVCLFKVLLTNVCVNDCAYCVNQIGRDVPRSAFLPDELAKTFMDLHSKKLAQGLFLSSGIGQNPTRTMESMIKTVEILRRRYQFKGYIHLKILPGADFGCVEASCRLADRVSINVEAPTVQHLARLSRKKDLHDGILERMRWVKQLTANNDGLVPSGQTTQFVVGAAGETDKDILHTTAALYHDMDLRRVYFSAFTPIRQSRLENMTPTPPMREHRLYQSDWLLRIYRFTPGEVELALNEAGNLWLRKDPKLVIAQKQPWLFPVDVNRASYEELLRVPGIGPVSAQRILEARRDHSIFSVEQLKKMRVLTGKAIPFIWFKGMLDFEKQLSFMPQLESEPAVPELSLAGVTG